MLIRGLGLGLLALTAFTGAQTPRAPLFTPTERNSVMSFWSDPGRYSVTLPENAEKNGVFQVRLTTAGSIWLREYNRARGLTKVPPTTTAQPQNEEQKAWQVWIDSKVEFDRWQAMQIANDSNRRLVGHETKFDDKTLPKTAPPTPGPMPDGLFALGGNPPNFAEAVIPMQHEITFPDGTTVKYFDNVKMRKNYAYYRFERGVNSEGVSVKSMSPEKLDNLFEMAGVTPSEAKVMKSVSILEGGFDSINTYDTGFVSVGFIQFATLKDGGNSLGELLRQYKADDPEHFQEDFHQYGIDVSPTGILACVDLETGAELLGEAATRKVIEDKRLIAVFQRAGLKSDAFNAAQIKSAKSQFFPASDMITIKVEGRTLSGHVNEIIKSEAGMATLMDRKVNTGKTDPLQATVERIANANHVQNFADLAKYEYEIVSALKYRKDYLADATLTQPAMGENRATSRKSSPSRSGGARGSRGGGHMTAHSR